MKKLSLSILLSVAFISFATAFDWGGKLYNSTEFAGENFSSLKLNQYDNANLWMKVPFNKKNSSYMVGDISYKFKYETFDVLEEKAEHILNLNLLNFVFDAKVNNNNKFLFSFGRIVNADATGVVFAQNFDGLKIDFNNTFTNISLFGGYTGLLNNKEVSMLTPSTTKYVESENNFYTFAPKYIPFGVTFNFPSLFANQHLTLQGLGFVDLNDDNYSRYYADLKLEGFLFSNLYYSLSSIFGTVNFTNIMNTSLFNLSYYVLDSLAINAGAEYSSGQNGIFDSFVGFTSIDAINARMNTKHTSLIKADLSVTYSLIEKLLFNAGFAYVADCSSSSVMYRGVQWNATAIYNVLNDVQLSVNLNQFCGKNADDNKASLSLNVSFIF